MIIREPFTNIAFSPYGRRPKGSWQFVFNIKHSGGSQRQRYRQRYSFNRYGVAFTALKAL